MAKTNPNLFPLVFQHPVKFPMEDTTLSPSHSTVNPRVNPDPPSTIFAAHQGLILHDFLSPNPTRKDNEPLTKNTGFMSPLNNPSLLSSFPVIQSSESPGDRRYKRMMKNRESATRSRARKTAYTIELERKKAYLTAENVRLVKEIQEQELVSAATQEEDPKKRDCSRSMSAPF